MNLSESKPTRRGIKAPSPSASGKGQSSRMPAKDTKKPLAESGPIFFFKPNEPHGEFFQWYPSIFTVPKDTMSELVGHPVDEQDPGGWEPIYFNCAEQFMMYCKAGRFHDSKTQREVMATRDPTRSKNGLPA